ncbi:hypothetical protein CPB84DRAFT_1962415 [Gymnopilus junonius]|uniref:RRM domain-containing protein n=1 Tax=Gymnopilus junonius TaxID=109634 RepID=A0A9P5NN89_GYMJU|nr:hypothetical protein CPB84DRAFT_1962415 [Gymnopilus junonius]
MFSSALRSQVRLSLFKAAVPASRSLTSFALSRATIQRSVLVPRATSAVIAQRAFSSAKALYQDRDQIDEPAPLRLLCTLAICHGFGTLESIRIQTHADGRPRGFAHVTFTDKESAVAAFTSAREEPLHVSGRDLYIDYARRPARTYTEVEPSSKVYFGKFTQEEEDLRALLGDFQDAITDVIFLRDGNTGTRLQSGFVELKDVETATEVINKLNGHVLEDGTVLRLSYARSRKEGADGRRAPRQDRPQRRGHYTRRSTPPVALRATTTLPHNS